MSSPSWISALDKAKYFDKDADVSHLASYLLEKAIAAGAALELPCGTVSSILINVAVIILTEYEPDSEIRSQVMADLKDNMDNIYAIHNPDDGIGAVSGPPN